MRLVGQVLAGGLVLALLAVLVGRVVREQESQAALERAPALELPRLDREGTLSLAAFRGKAVIVNFWASWCRPCEQEVPVLERTWRERRDDGLVVLGIDAEDAEADARRFAREHGISYPIVHDAHGEALKAFGVLALPETFFVDRRGRLVCEAVRGAVNARDELEERFEECLERALRF